MQKLPLSQIEPDPEQPRKIFDDAALRELADSIAASGLLQPITVRPVGKKRFQIVAGERRWRAHKILAETGRLPDGLVPCIIRDMDDSTKAIAAIVENMQRVDVTPLEESDALAKLADLGMDENEIAERVGCAVFRVKWRLQLQRLDPDIRKLFATGNLDKQQAMEIARLDTYREQRRILQMINRGQLKGWKAVRNAVDAMLNADDAPDMFGGKPSEKEVAAVRSIETKIAKVAAALASGWKDGECVVAVKVDRAKASLIADQLAAIQATARVMERELRNTMGQAALSVAAE